MTKKMKYKFLKNKHPETQDFWYDISDGGYLKAEDFSKDPATIEAINKAVKLLMKLQNRCEYE